jgi:hypothetical protein
VGTLRQLHDKERPRCFLTYLERPAIKHECEICEDSEDCKTRSYSRWRNKKNRPFLEEVFGVLQEVARAQQKDREEADRKNNGDIKNP